MLLERVVFLFEKSINNNSWNYYGFSGNGK